VSEARHIELDSVRMTVTPTFEATGSILAGTARHMLSDVQTTLEIESRAPRADVATLVETAEQMCFVMDALQRPHEVARTVMINGVPVA
jgi:organic hydroperoxide reductase OsmC/OhrA